MGSGMFCDTRGWNTNPVKFLFKRSYLYVGHWFLFKATNPVPPPGCRHPKTDVGPPLGVTGAPRSDVPEKSFSISLRRVLGGVR